MGARSALIVICGVIALAVAYSIIESRSANKSVCEVQSRGLKAQQHLTIIMQDISKLVTPIPGAKPKPVPLQLAEPLVNLREELGAYLAIEAEQPKERKC